MLGKFQRRRRVVDRAGTHHHDQPPVLAADARILILGSFPSQASLAARQYYGHRQNQFWRILAAVTGAPLAEMDYAARTQAVQREGIAIWDVYASCLRQGSLDAAIRDAAPNDFRRLKRLAPRLARVCFNGRKAGSFAPQMAAMGYETVLLPSTSPAFTLSFEKKCAAWRAALSG